MNVKKSGKQCYLERVSDQIYNKLFKSDSQRVAFLLCVRFSG